VFLKQAPLEFWICQEHTGLYDPVCNVTVLSRNRCILTNEEENTEIAIDENGCQVVTPISYTDQFGLDIQTSIYPQPANTCATISIFDLDVNESYSLTIVDLNGRVVDFFENLSSSSFEIPIMNYEQGMYMVEVKTNMGKVQRNKLLIAK
jgi:hypothetical protein